MPDSDSVTKTASTDWTWTDTPDPNQDIFTVFVDTERIRLENKPTREVPALGATPYTAPTQFKALAPAFGLSHLLSLGVGDWYFIGRQMGNPTSTFHFFKNKSLADINTPWETVEIIGNHFWPMVVLAVWIETDYNFLQSSNVIQDREQGIITGPTHYIRDTVLPDIEEGSTIITRKFLSATQPFIPKRPVPQPMAMSVQVNGASREYPKVLHDDLFIEATESGTMQYLTSGLVTTLGGAVGEHFFPATNFPYRKPYILTDEPVRNALGLWERTQIEVRPPKLLPIDR